MLSQPHESYGGIVEGMNLARKGPGTGTGGMQKKEPQSDQHTTPRKQQEDAICLSR